ncbi:MAG TPA: PadR family transcriptional regulator [Gammaproteobacteria bacterium]|nr:PadR family transcriptional regulator [Gammaproteobacteria bacterium]
MALAHAIMVSLLDRPQTGYELGKRFERTVGFFWKASHQQIYQELHRMARHGWVTAETVPQSERPNRIVYQLTDGGRRALDEWIATPSDPPSVKEELLVKLFALGDADAGTLVRQVERRLSLHRQRLAEYEAIRDRHYPEPSTLKPRQRGRYLGLRMGILSEQASIAWCREALALLGELRGQGA